MRESFGLHFFSSVLRYVPSLCLAFFTLDGLLSLDAHTHTHTHLLSVLTNGNVLEFFIIPYYTPVYTSHLLLNFFCLIFSLVFASFCRAFGSVFFLSGKIVCYKNSGIAKQNEQVFYSLYCAYAYVSLYCLFIFEYGP